MNKDAPSMMCIIVWKLYNHLPSPSFYSLDNDARHLSASLIRFNWIFMLQIFTCCSFIISRASTTNESIMLLSTVDVKIRSPFLIILSNLSTFYHPFYWCNTVILRGKLPVLIPDVLNIQNHIFHCGFYFVMPQYCRYVLYWHPSFRKVRC